MTDAPLACGLDLGGTKLLGVVLDPHDPVGGVLLDGRRPTPHGDEAVVAAVLELALELVDRAGVELGRHAGSVGLGAPGLVDRTGTLRYGPNLPGVVDVPFTGRLAEATGLAVTVDNDATCAVWGEHQWGAAQGCDHTILVTLGTGIGAGMTVKGEVLRGANGFAGEPGHMVVDPDGPLCPCGRRGCWERYASGSGLGHLAREAAVAGRGARFVELAGGDPELVKGEHVSAAAREGDADALAVYDRFGWWVALGIANLVNVLDSEMVVLGGGLAEAADLLLPPVRAHYEDLVLAHAHRPRVPIVTAHLGERAGAVGAALLAHDRRPRTAG